MSAFAWFFLGCISYAFVSKVLAIKPIANDFYKMSVLRSLLILKANYENVKSMIESKNLVFKEAFDLTEEECRDMILKDMDALDKWADMSIQTIINMTKGYPVRLKFRTWREAMRIYDNAMKKKGN
jgi:hypothetical protein